MTRYRVFIPKGKISDFWMLTTHYCVVVTKIVGDGNEVLLFAEPSDILEMSLKMQINVEECK